MTQITKDANKEIMETMENYNKLIQRLSATSQVHKVNILF